MVLQSYTNEMMKKTLRHKEEEDGYCVVDDNSREQKCLPPLSKKRKVLWKFEQRTMLTNCNVDISEGNVVLSKCVCGSVCVEERERESGNR